MDTFPKAPDAPFVHEGRGLSAPMSSSMPCVFVVSTKPKEELGKFVKSTRTLAEREANCQRNSRMLILPGDRQRSAAEWCNAWLERNFIYCVATMIGALFYFTICCS